MEMSGRESKFHAVAHIIAEFMGVAENDSSDEELDNIDHPDGVASNRRISNNKTPKT